MDYMSYIRAIRSADLTTVQKITAIMIASHYDFTKGDPAFPSNKLLSKETGLAVSTIVKAKKVLSERSYLYYQIRWDNSCIYTPMIPSIKDYATKEKLNTHINTQLNTQLNTQEIQSNSNEFDISINLIDTGRVVEIASETIETAPAKIKELTPAEIDELLSW
jgi:DNA-binding transcriptional MocR family regulator